MPLPSKDRPSDPPRVLGAIALSGVLHAVLYATWGSLPLPAAPPTVSRVRIRVREAPPLPKAEPPPLPSAPPEAPKRVPAPPKAPRPGAVPPSPPSPAPRPADPEPTPVAAAPTPKLPGITLTGDGPGASAALPEAGGAFEPTAMPMPQSLPPEPAAAPAPTPPLRPPPPPIVAFKDLSERPRPPALDALLQSLYPSDARARGLSGSARVRARIDADGRVREVHLLDESAPGFGNACRRTLLGSVWSPPRDQQGHSVSTEIRYTCHFLVAS